MKIKNKWAVKSLRIFHVLFKKLNSTTTSFSSSYPPMFDGNNLDTHVRRIPDSSLLVISGEILSLQMPINTTFLGMKVKIRVIVSDELHVFVCSVRPKWREFSRQLLLA